MVLFILITSSAVCILAGTATYISSKKYCAKCTETTTGIVVGNHKGSPSPAHNINTSTANYSSGAYFPIVDYLGYRKTMNNGQAPAKYKAGDRVVVHFNPNNIDESYIEETQISQIIGMVFTLIGVLMTIITVIYVCIV